MISKNLKIIFIIVLALLLIPFIAMQFSNEVNWNIMDFVIMGLMLFGIGLLIDLILRKLNGKYSRVAAIIFVVLAFIVFWAELAVGIFGTAIAGN